LEAPLRLEEPPRARLRAQWTPRPRLFRCSDW